MQKVWLVTGTSTGFGKALVEELLAQDQLVVATARKVSAISQWVDRDDVLVQPLDVTKASDIDVAVKAAKDRFGRVDVLVNNAGWGYFGAVEEADEATVREMMDTNFWGTVNMTRAILPLMRAQHAGYVVNISSIAGIVGTPGFGFYNATKHAVEGIMKALLQEVAPLGIKITNVEPGPFRTDWAGRSHQDATVNIADYEQTAHKTASFTEANSGQQDGSPELVAKAIVYLAGTDNPPLHFLAGKNAFERAQEELDNEQSDFSDWAEQSQHLYYGDEEYWK